ncbi:hypothetical protein AVEN_192741-1 [Araneus ventricosus]|uniref:Uncharacterized protein n=1 Tax=Araneus ventricosus TaxID=182803 RepID=A0A4Y2KQZ1_ARAVE|nr:hypothetical protein AVEN_192741-1 [Araneus ventricosus]
MAFRVPNGSLPTPKENKPICRPQNFDFCRATNRNWTATHRKRLPPSQKYFYNTVALQMLFVYPYEKQPTNISSSIRNRYVDILVTPSFKEHLSVF